MTGSFIDVTLDSGEKMPAFVVQASGGGSRSGLVLVQEIFGVNENIRATARAFASQGYDVIAPDLFWRLERRIELDPANADDRERATAYMKALDQAKAIDDLLAAAAYLRTNELGLKKVGAVGYCLGGKLAYLLSTNSTIDAAVSYYGVAIQGSLDLVPVIKAPLLLHLAVEDHLCPPEAQAKIHAALDSVSNVTVLDYPGVGHAFARLGGGAFNVEAAALANNATDAFLRKAFGINQ